jgi:hypothetical protein
MHRLGARRRRVLALFLAVSVVTIGAALADTPESGLGSDATVNVTPSDNLTDNQLVEVVGVHFGNQREIDVMECTNANPEQCSERLTPIDAARPGDTGVRIRTTTDGNFTAHVKVTASFAAFVPDPKPTIDCRVTQCYLEASPVTGGVVAHHHINFATGVTCCPTTTTAPPPTTAAPTSSTTSTTRGIFTPSTTTSSTTPSSSGAGASTTLATGTRIVDVGDPPEASAATSTTSPGASAQAVDVPRALARTGTSSGRLGVIGVALVLLGSMVLVHARREPEGAGEG